MSRKRKIPDAGTSRNWPRCSNGNSRDSRNTVIVVIAVAVVVVKVVVIISSTSDSDRSLCRRNHRIASNSS